MSDRHAHVEGSPLVIHWRIARHFFFTWEVDMEAVLPLLPAGVTPVELRPGVALLSTGVLVYAGGHFGAASLPFTELVTVVQVVPDLSLRMPAPRFTFYSLAVYSDSPEFVENEGRTLYTPTALVPSLTATLTEDGLGVDVADDRGPILSLRNTSPEVVYAPTEFYGQHYTRRPSLVGGPPALQLGIFEWDGIRCEHMRPGDAGRLYPHPHFGGLDVTRVRRCYRQMYSEPGGLSNERFYQMNPVLGASARAALVRTPAVAR